MNLFYFLVYPTLGLHSDLFKAGLPEADLDSEMDLLRFGLRFVSGAINLSSRDRGGFHQLLWQTRPALDRFHDTSIQLRKGLCIISDS